MSTPASLAGSSLISCPGLCVAGLCVLYGCGVGVGAGPAGAAQPSSNLDPFAAKKG